MHRRPRFCRACGKQLFERHKQYCDTFCQREWEYRDYIARWLRGEAIGLTPSGQLSHYVRHFLIEEAGERCSECHWRERNPVTGRVPLQIDHIDGHYANCRRDNLRVLCPNCHSLTPSWGVLNKGNGRPIEVRGSP